MVLCVLASGMAAAQNTNGIPIVHRVYRYSGRAQLLGGPAANLPSPPPSVDEVLVPGQDGIKINTNLNYLGQESVIDPPAVPIFDAVAPQNLSITLVLGVPKITLTCPTSPGEDTVISACAPVNSGVRRAPQLKILGTCPAPVQGSADITALYEAMFGVPALGSRIFASAHKMTNGWTGPTSLFSGLVPRV